MNGGEEEEISMKKFLRKERGRRAIWKEQLKQLT
jgi:hypothetical protein